MRSEALGIFGLSLCCAGVYGEGAMPLLSLSLEIDRGFGELFAHADRDDVPSFKLDFPSSSPKHDFAKMNVLLLLSLLFFIPLVLLAVFLALSSCMGDSFRASVAGIPVTFRGASFGRQYTRGFGSGAGSAGWEQIEMEDMLGEDSEEED